jgi:selenocysteine lyase/cysteine desulfurase
MKYSPDNVKDDILKLCQQKKFEDARERLANMINEGAIALSRAEQLLWQATIEGMAGNHKSENQILLKAYDIDSSYAALLFSLTRSHLKMEQHELCAKVAIELLELESRSGDSYFSGSSRFFLSFSYLCLGDYPSFNNAVSKVDDNHVVKI